MIRLFNFKKEIRQFVTAVDYPEKLVIVTYCQLKSGVWRMTDLISVILKPFDLKEITELVLKHLDLSKSVKEKDIDFELIEKNYRARTGFTSIKKQMMNSKSVEISRDNDLITFLPTKNGGTSGKNKGYSPIQEKMLVMDFNYFKDTEIGECLEEAFLFCE